MWLLLELILLPLLIVTWIVMSSLAVYVGVGALIIGIVALLFVGTIVGLILHFLWRLEIEAGIHDSAHSN